MSASLQRIWSFHLRDLEAAGWKGLNTDIGEQHQDLFRDILEDDNFKIPSKRILGKCMLLGYPWANPALRDRIRDCILDVLKDIKIRLKSSTSGKKAASLLEKHARWLPQQAQPQKKFWAKMSANN